MGYGSSVGTAGLTDRNLDDPALYSSSAIRGASRLKIQTPSTQRPTKIAAAGSR